MYFTTTTSSLILVAFSQLATLTPLQTRQDTTLGEFKLLGPETDCFNAFEFNDSGDFTATCVSVQAVPQTSTIGMNACIANEWGNMVYQANGGAFASCTRCSLDQNTLDLTCSCDSGNSDHTSTINLDGTQAENGNGVFIRDNGRISCRAPVA